MTKDKGLGMDKEMILAHLESRVKAAEPGGESWTFVKAKYITAMIDMMRNEAVPAVLKDGGKLYCCGECGKPVFYKSNYCRHCGKPLTWEDNG